MTNPIQYTSRTFKSVMNDINSDSELVDTPEFYKRIVSGSHDVLSMYNNAEANNSYLRTAFTRKAVLELLRLIDYAMSGKSTSTGTLVFYLDPSSVVFPKTAALADLVARSQGTIDSVSKKFEARASVTITSPETGTFTADYITGLLAVSRVFLTGEKVRLTTSGVLPAGLETGIDYYAIYVSDTSIRFAESVTDAFKGTAVSFTDNGTGTHTFTLYSFRVTAYQQDTKEKYSVGKSDGVKQWQQFDLQFLDVIPDTLEIEINGINWTLIDSVVDSESDDRNYIIRFNNDNSSFIQFGNNEMGAVPGNFDIYATHAVGGGLDSNIKKLNRINVYSGSDSDIVGVANVTEFTGGSDAEDMEIAKILGPILLKARSRFITSTDGRGLAMKYSGVSLAKIMKNYYGILSARVLIVPSGGGTAGPALLAALQEYLIDLTILESIDVRAESATYYSVTPVLTVKLDTGYTLTDVKPYIMFVLYMLFHETGYELLNYYKQNGIANFITTINSNWSFSFTTSDYTQIKFIMDNIETADFGATYQDSDCAGFIDSFVYGVAKCTWVSPTLPIELDEDEITTVTVVESNITGTT